MELKVRVAGGDGREGGWDWEWMPLACGTARLWAVGEKLEQERARQTKLSC